MMHGGGPGTMGMMGGMDGMMDMMQRMHGNMMGGGMMAGMGPMGGGMMQMFDADGDGTVTPEEMRSQLQARLAEYDSDGDGSLSIAEFETLHSAMIREMMVDRFQHLDADGDGAVTAEEMTAPADMMERMQGMRSNMAQSPGQPGNGQGMGDGPMMNDN
ncbi:calcium-binding protein [Rhodobacteraceae bacterium 2CG4]|uniref:Calcium-binding protein n=2 Tax=Halovulum marinum TaxID=2662447 RepID=A0A6L5Z4Y2_9RHOB|nr:calcium-binding protein [Halovulum marinum]